jgi:hypothetical protein
MAQDDSQDRVLNYRSRVADEKPAHLRNRSFRLAPVTRQDWVVLIVLICVLCAEFVCSAVFHWFR